MVADRPAMEAGAGSACRSSAGSGSRTGSMPFSLDDQRRSGSRVMLDPYDESWSAIKRPRLEWNGKARIPHRGRGD